MERDPQLEDRLVEACRLVAEATRITVLTGAGISTESGIPDFRGPDGVWTKNPAAEKMATILPGDRSLVADQPQVSLMDQRRRL